MKDGAITFLCMFSFLLLSACRQQNTLADLKHYVLTLKQEPGAAIAKLPDFHLSTAVKTHQQRDPFVALTTQPQQLQAYALADLKLVGTLIQPQHRVALLQIPQGIVCVRPGQTIGAEAAKVIAIMAKYIKLQSTNKQQMTRDFIIKMEH